MLQASSLSLLLLFSSGGCTIVNPTIGDTFRECLISQSSRNLGQCLGVGAISKLQSLDDNSEFDLIDGVTLIRDEQQFRETYNFAGGDPSSFRSIMDSFNHVFSQRSLRWDLSNFYPGLAMRIAPSVSPGGTLEFILDPHRESLNVHALKEASTGRLLARQFLVPFLLGFKFNLASILPILFGVLALLAKKAVIVSKIALIISSAFALGSLLFGAGNKLQQPYQTGLFNPGFGGGGYKYPEDEYHEAYYRAVDKQNSSDQLRLYPNAAETYDRNEREEQFKGRNFAWSEHEKAKNENSY